MPNSNAIVFLRLPARSSHHGRLCRSCGLRIRPQRATNRIVKLRGESASRLVKKAKSTAARQHGGSPRILTRIQIRIAFDAIGRKPRECQLDEIQLCALLYRTSAHLFPRSIHGKIEYLTQKWATT